MSAWVLTRTRMVAGVWEGILSGGAGAPPMLEAYLHGRLLDPPRIEPEGHRGQASRPNHWQVLLDLPREMLGDGVQTVVICDKATGERMAAITMISGEEGDTDLRAEVEVLKAELALLKRSFRRHVSAQTRR